MDSEKLRNISFFNNEPIVIGHNYNYIIWCEDVFLFLKYYIIQYNVLFLNGHN